MKYKAVVFDYGGVLEQNSGGNPVRLIAELMSVPLEDFKKVYFKYNHLSNAENLPWIDMIKFVVSEFDDSELMWNKVKALISNFESKSVPNVALLNILPSLKERGYLTAIFSNYTSELRSILAEQNILQYFDEVVISGEIGLQKPSKEAFEAMFSSLGVKPQEIVFIDDTPKSLETAGELGYTPILFKDNEQLFSELTMLGILG
jgi:epoxide hydrolase-like predicted phosphatase